MLICQHSGVESRALQTVLKITVFGMRDISNHLTQSQDHGYVMCRKHSNHSRVHGRLCGAATRQQHCSLERDRERLLTSDLFPQRFLPTLQQGNVLRTQSSKYEAGKMQHCVAQQRMCAARGSSCRWLQHSKTHDLRVRRRAVLHATLHSNLFLALIRSLDSCPSSVIQTLASTLASTTKICDKSSVRYRCYGKRPANDQTQRRQIDPLRLLMETENTRCIRMKKMKPCGKSNACFGDLSSLLRRFSLSSTSYLSFFFLSLSFDLSLFSFGVLCSRSFLALCSCVLTLSVTFPFSSPLDNKSTSVPTPTRVSDERALQHFHPARDSSFITHAPHHAWHDRGVASRRG